MEERNPNIPSDKPFYKVSQVAKMLGVHPDTVRRWSKKGIIKAYRSKKSRYRLFCFKDIRAVDDWIVRIGKKVGDRREERILERDFDDLKAHWRSLDL